MFVRLFVDENLDRMVPISRQPKEKIQAIIESCTRQFPEFSDRARKRIRTYLKSCRRTRRHKAAATLTNGTGNSGAKDLNSHNDVKSLYTSTSTSPSSYHLSSPMAEQILANACANEFQNAKRMRIGLKPLPVNSSAPLDNYQAIPLEVYILFLNILINKCFITRLYNQLNCISVLPVFSLVLEWFRR